MPLPQLDDSLLARVAVLCAPERSLASGPVVLSLPHWSLVAERGHPS